MWLQCFAVFVGVVANYEPEVVPGLMAYMVSIIRASQEYEGAAWVAYDAAYRRQAAATGSKKWGGVNTYHLFHGESEEISKVRPLPECWAQDRRMLCARRGGWRS